GGPFAVAHCNFRLRGADSDADETLVRDWAARYGVTCHVRGFDTEAFAAQEGISIEMAARRLRYHWFGELCREHGYSAVAVAHNANDNAETLILNLLRGTGLKGLTGMKAEGFIPDPDFADIPLLRPLLGMTREEIEAFATEHNLTWREDATNAQNEYKRNKIRNQVFPIFKEINPSFIQTLNNDIQSFSDLYEELEANGMDLQKTVAARGHMNGRGPLAEGQWEGRRGEAPEVLRRSIPLAFQIKEEIWDGTKDVKQPEGELIMDADKFDGVMEFSSWETGDWIKPLGAPGKKKLQDWFTDHHIPADEKPFVKLLRSSKDPHHILAIAGWCIDHSLRVTPRTKRIIHIVEKK
ncbi:MAG: tRNA lysidine(34) synthetase TilS, partial [Bacteroidales bacterium]|nr:tRNA lysidine(34) synthetase TilS [Bacteroidales bacterium]